MSVLLAESKSIVDDQQRAECCLTNRRQSLLVLMMMSLLSLSLPLPEHKITDFLSWK